MKRIEGACLCGAVRVSVVGSSKWVAHCHCSMCRRAHGAGYVTWLGARGDAATIEDEEGRLGWYASSPGAERGFCRRCGTTLLFRSQRWPDELHIAVGALLDGPDRAPQAHVWWSAHVDWASIDPTDGLPRRDAVG
jgi:hypothetical protein